MGWIEEYIEYHKNLTDAPEEYAEVLALSLLGHAIGRDSIHPLKPFPIRHNIYVILLGEAGKSRKSTSINIAKEIAESYIYPSRFSPEALMDEFSAILRKAFDRRSYVSGTLELLSEVYDCPEELKRRTRSGGLVTARNLYVSLVACTTSEGFKSSIEPEALKQGFLTRCIIIEPKKKKSRPRDYLNSEIYKQKMKLKNGLRFLKNKVIEFRFEKEAHELYNEYHDKLERKYRKKVEGGFLSRYQDYMIKFADLYQLSDEIYNSQFSQNSQVNKLTILVQEDNIIKSYKLIDRLLKNIMRICEFCESSKLVLKVKTVLEKHGKCDRSKLLRYSHLTARELDIALETLLQSGEVVKDKEFYKLKRKI